MKSTYEAIQHAIRDAKECLPVGPHWAGIEEVVDNLCYYLAENDRDFKKERFRRGCDPQQFAEDQKEEGWL